MGKLISGYMLRVFSAFLAFMGFASTVAAQYGVFYAEYHFKGKIMSEKSREPLENVDVRLQKQHHEARQLKTDEDGRFATRMRLRMGNTGEWKLVVEEQEVKGVTYLAKDSTVNLMCGWGPGHDTSEVVLYLNEKETREHKGKQPERKGRLAKHLKDLVEYEKRPTDSAVRKPETTVVAGMGPKNDGAQAKRDWEWGVYPNPARHSVVVEIPASDEVQNLWVYDFHGRLIFAESIPISGMMVRKKLDVSALSKGTYLIGLGRGNEKQMKKLVIQ